MTSKLEVSKSKQSADCYQRAKTALSYYSVRLSVPKVILKLNVVDIRLPAITTFHIYHDCIILYMKEDMA